MKRGRAVLSFCCFVIGYLGLAVGLLMALLGLLTLGDPANPKPLADLLYQALPGVVVAVCAVLFLFTARALDPAGLVVRRHKRQPNTRIP